MVEVEREISGEANGMHGAAPFVARCGAHSRLSDLCHLTGTESPASDYERRWWWSVLAHSVM
jgi:hypothetical protein